MALRWVFDADTSRFSKGLDRMRTESQAAVNGLKSQFKKLGGIIGAAVSAKAIANSVDRVNRLTQAAQRLNTSLDFVQELEGLSGKIYGADLDNLVEFLQDVNEKAIDAAAGGGDAAEAFDLLRINAEEFVNLNLRQQFHEIANAIANAEDKQAAIAATMKIGSDEATKLLPLLRKGGDEIARMTEEMSKFGSESTTTLLATRAAMKELNRDTSNFITTGLGGLSLMMEGVGEASLSMFRDHETMGEGFMKPFQRALDREAEFRNSLIDAASDRKDSLKGDREDRAESDHRASVEKELQKQEALLKARVEAREKEAALHKQVDADLARRREEAERHRLAMARDLMDKEAALMADQNSASEAPSLSVTNLRSIGGGSLTGMAANRQHLRAADSMISLLSRIAENTERSDRDGTKATAKPRG